MVRAWREGLDRDHNDRMDYNEFSVAVKDVGYAGNAKELWQELDVNKNGYVSLWVPWNYSPGLFLGIFCRAFLKPKGQSLRN